MDSGASLLLHHRGRRGRGVYALLNSEVALIARATSRNRKLHPAASTISWADKPWFIRRRPYNDSTNAYRIRRTF